MSFYFSFNGANRADLHAHADRAGKMEHVPASAVAFVKESIDAYPDGTMLEIVGSGHKAHVNPPIDGEWLAGGSYVSMLAATLDIKVRPIVATPVPRV